MMKQKFLAVLLFTNLPLFAHAADYTVDPQHTFTNFTINHLGFSTMHGSFDKSTGKITFDPTAKKGSIDIVVSPASVHTGLPKRDEHLKSPDFFNVAEYPEITFKSSTIKFKGDTPVSVDGKLTILGVTKPVTLTISSFKCGTHPLNKKELCGADASTQIKRSDFGMKFGVPDVGDEVKLVLEVEAYRD
ncbi:MAG: YceI family protein [Pseudomonadota bacterium]